jgi:hypothetical protein
MRAAELVGNGRGLDGFIRSSHPRPGDKKGSPL